MVLKNNVLALQYCDDYICIYKCISLLKHPIIEFLALRAVKGEL